MIFAFALMAVMGVTYYLLCLAENKRRDSLHGPAHDNPDVGLEADREDKTDGQNTNFRYTY